MNAHEIAASLKRLLPPRRLPLEGRVAFVDIDGTLADNRHRQHMVPDKELRGTDEGWRQFHLAAVNDSPVMHTLAVVHALWREGAAIVLFTARPEWMRTMTLEWVSRHFTAPFELVMRPDGCLDKARDLKPRFIREWLERNHMAPSDVTAVFEDSTPNAKVLVESGLPVFFVPGHGEESMSETNMGTPYVEGVNATF